jgi:hypothetical protein
MTMLTCVECSTRIGCSWCTILSRRLSSESRAPAPPAYEGTSHDSMLHPVGPTCVERSTRIGCARCPILSRLPPEHESARQTHRLAVALVACVGHRKGHTRMLHGRGAAAHLLNTYSTLTPAGGRRIRFFPQLRKEMAQFDEYEFDADEAPLPCPIAAYLSQECPKVRLYTRVSTWWRIAALPVPSMRGRLPCDGWRISSGYSVRCSNVGYTCCWSRRIAVGRSFPLPVSVRGRLPCDRRRSS